MKKKYQNIFFIFGLVVLAVMVSQLHFAEVWQGPQRRATRRRKRDARESRASRSSRESRNSRETRESRNSRDSRVPRESRDARDVRSARGLLVALQDHRLRLCPQLRHARRLDGRRALPHHGPQAQDRHGACHGLSTALRDDPHLQPLLVLDAEYRASWPSCSR